MSNNTDKKDIAISTYISSKTFDRIKKLPRTTNLSKILREYLLKYLDEQGV